MNIWKKILGISLAVSLSVGMSIAPVYADTISILDEITDEETTEDFAEDTSTILARSSYLNLGISLHSSYHFLHRPFGISLVHNAGAQF